MIGERTAGAADAYGVERHGRAGNGAGRATRFLLRDEQRPGGADRRQRCTLGDAIAAGLAEHGVGWGRQPCRLGEEIGRREESRGDREPRGELMDGRLVRLEIERDHRGDGAAGEIVLGQCRLDQGDQLLRGAAALAADAERQHGRVQDEGALIRRRRAVGDADREIAGFREVSREPIGIARLDVKGDGRPGEQGGGDRLHLRRVGDAPARRRLVEAEAEAEVAGRGDGRNAAGRSAAIAWASALAP